MRNYSLRCVLWRFAKKVFKRICQTILIATIVVGATVFCGAIVYFIDWTSSNQYLFEQVVSLIVHTIFFPGLIGAGAFKIFLKI